MKNNDEDSKKLLTPTGAIIAVIFFFLPWLKTSCGTVSGADIAKADELIWLVFISALLIVIIYFGYNNIKRLSKAVPFVLLLSAIGLGIIFIKGADLAKQLPRRSGLTVGIGLIGTIIGFILAIIGVAFFKDSSPTKIILTESEVSNSKSLKCPSCGNEVLRTSKYCDNCGIAIYSWEKNQKNSPPEDAYVSQKVINTIYSCDNCGCLIEIDDVEKARAFYICPDCGIKNKI